MTLKDILKKHIKEDVLTEDMSNEIGVLFEATISEKVAVLTEAKEKELEEKYSTELTEFKDMLIEKINDYIELSMEDFITENKEPLENDVKIKMAEKVMENVISNLKECYVKIPETEIDAIKDLTSQVKEMKKDLNEATNKNRETEKQIFEYEKAIKISKLTEDMTDMNRDKIITLVENIDTTDIEDFAKKSKIIIDNFEIKKEDDLINNDDDGKILNEDLNNTTDDDDIEEYEIDKYLPVS